MTNQPMVRERVDCRAATCVRVSDVHFASALSRTRPHAGRVAAKRYMGATDGPMLFRAAERLVFSQHHGVFRRCMRELHASGMCRGLRARCEPLRAMCRARQPAF